MENQLFSVSIKVKKAGTITISNIDKGVIRTTDGRYVIILEVAAVNYDKLPVEERAKIIDAFGALFKTRRIKLQFKIMNNPASAADLVKNIKKSGRSNEKDLKEPIERYTEFVNYSGKIGACNTRYFLICEYEGKESDIEIIGNDMKNLRTNISNILRAANSYVITDENYDIEQLEYLYTFFNRTTSQYESLYDRILRLKNDYVAYNKKAKKPKELTIADMIAPKGINLANRKYIFMDGLYYGFIGFNSKTYPARVTGAWLDRFAYGNVVDLDVIIKKLPREFVKNALKTYNTFSEKERDEAESKGKTAKYRKYSKKLYANQMVESALQSGQDLYNFAVIITVRANTARELGDYIRQIENDLKTMCNIEIDESLDCAEEYFAMTMPLLFITKPFRRIKHNILTEQLKSIFPMTAYNLYDPRGWVCGRNKDNESLTAINLFNNHLYKNANLVILGAPGSGKTYTMCLMSERLYLNGVDCYFIIPQKGENFLGLARMLNATYIQMFPGSKVCINVMEIRPEKAVDDSMLDDNTFIDMNRSWRDKHITFLTTWLKLVASGINIDKRTLNIINDCLVNVYEAKGITQDNESIYEVINGNKQIKDMPIIQDMYDEFAKHPELSEIRECLKIFITGSFKNFNGRTNIDLTNSHMIIFNCDVRMIGEDMHGAIQEIAFGFCESRIKDPSSGRSCVVMDEAWQMMKTPETAKQVQDFVKIVRGYLSSTIIATQEIEDFLLIDGGAGKSVLNDSATKLVLGMEEGAGIDLLQKHLKLTEAEANKIINYRTGEGMILSQGQKTELLIEPSPYEDSFFADKTRKNQTA